MYFDTHAHYDDSAFEEDRESLIQMLFKEGKVDRIIDPGCDLPSSEKAKLLAETHANYYFAAGIHPEEIEEIPFGWEDKIRTLVKHPKCVAIGEIGLDYHWEGDRLKQADIFEKQLHLATDMNKPVIIHDRDAHGDCFEIVRRFSNLHGVFHCYSGSAEMAKELLRMGWYLGFDGPVTYKNARKTLEVLEICPLNRILLETDSPYMSPVPVRGTRNNSANLQYICAKVAACKGISEEECAKITSENACRLFSVE